MEARGGLSFPPSAATQRTQHQDPDVQGISRAEVRPADARSADLRSLAVQSGLDCHVVEDLARRGQLHIAVRLANTPEGRARRHVDVRERGQLIRRQVLIERGGAPYPGWRALDICQYHESRALGDEISSWERAPTATLSGRNALALATAIGEVEGLARA